MLKGHTLPVWALLEYAPGFLASSSSDYTVRLWNLEKKSCILTLVGHTSPIWSLCFYDDILLSGSEDGLIKTWEY